MSKELQTPPDLNKSWLGFSLISKAQLDLHQAPIPIPIPAHTSGPPAPQAGTSQSEQKTRRTPVRPGIPSPPETGAPTRSTRPQVTRKARSNSQALPTPHLERLSGRWDDSALAEAGRVRKDPAPAL